MQDKLLHLPQAADRAARRPVADLAGLLAGWLRNRSERISLARLDDRTLKDIGITRADVQHEYARPFWEPVDHAALDAVRHRSGPRLG
jgi:uncharacterized protein YjiS (DUF1127 family)